VSVFPRKPEMTANQLFQINQRAFQIAEMANNILDQEKAAAFYDFSTKFLPVLDRHNKIRNQLIAKAAAFRRRRIFTANKKSFIAKAGSRRIAALEKRKANLQQQIAAKKIPRMKLLHRLEKQMNEKKLYSWAKRIKKKHVQRNK